jgi:predicted membrane protein
MSKIDKGRKWIWWFLGIIAAMQLYFVRELLAAFAIFALGFAAIAFVIASLYMAQKTWEAGVARLAASQNPMILAVRRSFVTVEELGRRPIRRPGSQAVS